MSCNIRCYGVLGDVSIGYPPDTGKLLTCYAPFRRSPPEYCYPALPLDLHVLSLPLAFILSQDQTLHCKSFILYSSSTILTSSFLKRNLRSNVFRVALYISYFLSSMLLVSIIISINCRSVTSPWRLPKRAANIGQNFYCTKTYFKYFLDYLLYD